MSNEEKIAVAKKRIIELKTLIKHWKNSTVSSRKSTVEFVELMLTNRSEREAA